MQGSGYLAGDCGARRPEGSRLPIVGSWAWHEWLLYGGIFWLLVVTPVGTAIFVLLENWDERRESRLFEGE